MLGITLGRFDGYGRELSLLRALLPDLLVLAFFAFPLYDFVEVMKVGQFILF